MFGSLSVSSSGLLSLSNMYKHVKLGKAWRTEFHLKFLYVIYILVIGYMVLSPKCWILSMFYANDSFNMILY